MWQLSLRNLPWLQRHGWTSKLTSFDCWRPDMWAWQGSCGRRWWRLTTIRLYPSVPLVLKGCPLSRGCHVLSSHANVVQPRGWFQVPLDRPVDQTGCLGSSQQASFGGMEALLWQSRPLVFWWGSPCCGRDFSSWAGPAACCRAHGSSFFWAEFLGDLRPLLGMALLAGRATHLAWAERGLVAPKELGEVTGSLGRTSPMGMVGRLVSRYLPPPSLYRLRHPILGLPLRPWTPPMWRMQDRRVWLRLQPFRLWQ